MNSERFRLPATEEKRRIVPCHNKGRQSSGERWEGLVGDASEQDHTTAQPRAFSVPGSSKQQLST